MDGQFDGFGELINLKLAPSKITSADYWHKPLNGELNQIHIRTSEAVDKGWLDNTTDFSDYFELLIDGQVVNILDIEHNTLPNDGFRLIIEEDKRPDEYSSFELIVKDGAFDGYKGGTYYNDVAFDFDKDQLGLKEEHYGSSSADKMDAGDLLSDLKLYGGKGNDELFGGHGHDELFGGEDQDHLKGKDGNDVLVGGLSHDTLEGGSGNDILNGGSGHDVMIGGDGIDTLVYEGY